MNQLTAQQRKILYMGGIIVLLVPIIWLGMPAGDDSQEAEGGLSGGKLAQLRDEYELGESTLGNIDPSSATMNLVLLGLRGIATDLLWMDAIDKQRKKNWAQLRSDVDSIILLQPHFMQVWRFQGWNLTYNVSTEWDAVADRYYWVKEGGKFIIDGVERNRRYPELYFDVGSTLGKKVGRADEWREFREFFRKDPDEETYNGGQDFEFSRFGGQEFHDNYLAAKYWYDMANKAEDGYEQHMMMRMLFRHYPARSMMDYPEALQREGKFDSTTQQAWKDAFDEWANVFGREEWNCTIGKIYLEVGDDDFTQMAKVNGRPESLIKAWVNSYQNLCNYRYFRARALAESEAETVAAHLEIFKGKELFKDGQVYPDRFRRIADVCRDLEKKELSKTEATILKVLCNAESSMTQHQIANLVSVENAKIKIEEVATVLLSLAKRKLLDRDVSPAKKSLETAMEKYAAMLERHPTLAGEDDSIDEALMVFLYWRHVHTLNGTVLPSDFPLRALVTERQGHLPSVEQDFRYENTRR